MQFVIDEKLPSLNEYVAACRANAYSGAKMIKQVERMIAFYIQQAVASKQLRPVDKPCEISILWHEKTKRRDVDNIQSAQKYILDALQACKILPNDNRKWVKQIYHNVVDDTRDYVSVRIEEIQPC